MKRTNNFKHCLALVVICVLPLCLLTTCVKEVVVGGEIVRGDMRLVPKE